MPLKNIFVGSFFYFRQNIKNMLLFSLAHMLFVVVGFEVGNGWHDITFLLWIALYYVFWFFFFRFYFNRKPYIFTKKIVGSIVPSTKILALTIIVLTVLLTLPLIPPFFDAGSEWANAYMAYLQIYMEDTRVVDAFTIAILVFVSPFIFYRPLMAWIASVIGRSGLLKTAFAKTKGSYSKMVLLGFIINSSFLLLEYLGVYMGIGNWLLIVLGSPIIIYFNVVMAKIYEYFFLEIGDDKTNISVDNSRS